MRDRMRMRQGKRGRVKMKEVGGRGRARAREEGRRGDRDKTQGMGKLIMDTKGRGKKERIRWSREEG